MSSVWPMTAPTVAPGLGRVNARALDATLRLVVAQVNALIDCLGIIRGGRGRLSGKVVDNRMLSQECKDGINHILGMLATIRRQYGDNYDPRQAAVAAPSSSDFSDAEPFFISEPQPPSWFEPALSLVGGLTGRVYSVRFRLRSLARRTLIAPAGAVGYNEAARLYFSPEAHNPGPADPAVVFPVTVYRIGGLAQDEARTLQLFQDVNDPAAVATFLGTWEEQVGIDHPGGSLYINADDNGVHEEVFPYAVGDMVAPFYSNTDLLAFDSAGQQVFYKLDPRWDSGPATIRVGAGDFAVRTPVAPYGTAVYPLPIVPVLSLLPTLGYPVASPRGPTTVGTVTPPAGAGVTTNYTLDSSPAPYYPVRPTPASPLYTGPIDMAAYYTSSGLTVVRAAFRSFKVGFNGSFIWVTRWTKP